MNTLLKSTRVNIASCRSYKQYAHKYLKEMYNRRIIAGPEPERRRSDWINWNYNAEIFSFQNRLGEEVEDGILRQCFIDESYKEVPMAESNSQMAEKGYSLTELVVSAFLRRCWENLPEEGIKAVSAHLNSNPVISHVGRNIGTTDLIYCKEIAPTDESVANALFSFIFAISNDGGHQRAVDFILDFVATQLIGKNIFDIWTPEDPVQELNNILVRSDLDKVEYRVLRQVGLNTVAAAYVVGCYVNRRLIGQSGGETLPIAVDMAAVNSLMRLFGVSSHCADSLPFGLRGRELELNLDSVNSSLSQFTINID